MSFFEETLFGNKRVKEKKLAKRLARPLSLVLTIVAVIGVVVLVMFVVIPELAQTVLFAWKDNTGICTGGTAFSGRVIYRQQ